MILGSVIPLEVVEQIFCMKYQRTTDHSPPTGVLMFDRRFRGFPVCGHFGSGDLMHGFIDEGVCSVLSQHENEPGTTEGSSWRIQGLREFECPNSSCGRGIPTGFLICPWCGTTLVFHDALRF